VGPPEGVENYFSAINLARRQPYYWYWACMFSWGRPTFLVKVSAASTTPIGENTENRVNIQRLLVLCNSDFRRSCPMGMIAGPPLYHPLVTPLRLSLIAKSCLWRKKIGPPANRKSHILISLSMFRTSYCCYKAHGRFYRLFREKSDHKNILGQLYHQILERKVTPGTNF